MHAGGAKGSAYISTYVCRSMYTILPVADPSVLNTLIVISVDDGLLRTSTGCAGPSSSSTLYVDWLKLTVSAVMN